MFARINAFLRIIGCKAKIFQPNAMRGLIRVDYGDYKPNYLVPQNKFNRKFTRKIYQKAELNLFSKTTRFLSNRAKPPSRTLGRKISASILSRRTRNCGENHRKLLLRRVVLEDLGFKFQEISLIVLRVLRNVYPTTITKTVSSLKMIVFNKKIK